ncbi:MAG TPA: TraR/DksA C4-type zinc finger protein [Acidimicrobiales bacterium]|jgi:RNA polymerase-binding transcription factor DksA
MQEQVVATLRASLEEERESLRRQLQELVPEGRGFLTFDENFADSGQVAAEQGEVKVLVNSLRDQLVEVERALGKIDGGSYGRCEVCGRDIAEPRLEAMPATRFCIDHA